MNASISPGKPVMTLRTPDEILAKIPYLVGYHPHESLVALAFGDDGRIMFTLRVDLPDPPDDPDSCEALADYLMRVFCGHGAVGAILVAYAPRQAEASPALRAAAEALAAADIAVLDRLIANGKRWWSDACGDPECCPRSGTPYDLEEHPVTAMSVFEGEVALAGEEDLRRSLDPVRGRALVAARKATRKVEAELADLAMVVEDDHDDDASSACGHTESLVEMGRACVDTLLRACASGPGHLSDEEVARASVLVSSIRVRDEIWSRMTRESAPLDVTLWTEVLRRSVEPYVVAPAALLAFAAWLRGHGSLARCALERAYASDPSYSMAQLIGQLLVQAVPPTAWPEGTDEDPG
ncbi:DUF4192 domain-containing protein [Actinopolymorpha alba]|uniref:DUF4192 domain-containing protein n=1 Tax=Actinopolymorpha alba TaxID=533267 RepID=UPI000380CD9C|nr:DUF4192 domain-containing protein [Actinopolymorpha alba]